MQIIKLYSSLMEPMLAVGKLFGTIDGILRSGHVPDQEVYNIKIQQILNKNKSAIFTVRSNWIYSLALNPSAYNIIYPKTLKKDEEIISETKKRTIQFYAANNEDVVKQICNNKEIMTLFVKDLKMRNDLYNTFISSIKQNPVNYDASCPSVIKTPENLLKFKTIANKTITSGIQNFNENDLSKLNNFFVNLPEELKILESKKELLKKTIAILIVDPDKYPDCLYEFKKNPEIIEAATIGWVKLLTRVMDETTGIVDGNIYPIGFLEYTHVPEEFKNDPRIINIKNNVKKQLVNFLNINFKKLFPEPIPPFYIPVRQQTESLINEFSDEDLIISLYWQEKEKLKKSVKNVPSKKLYDPEDLIKIKFNQDYEGVVISSNPHTEENKIFNQGDVREVEIIDDKGDTIDVEFIDGSVLYGLNKNVCDVIE